MVFDSFTSYHGIYLASKHRTKSALNSVALIMSQNV